MSTLPIQLNITPEQINEYLSKQILESALGEQIQEVVKNAFSSLNDGWTRDSLKNAIETIVKNLVKDKARELIIENYKIKIEEEVLKILTPDKLQEISKLASEKAVGAIIKNLTYETLA